ncbi:MAG: bifunctional (p)ppGpp synthetase/guanosine-3',5'-bis(diphosphate) 3'-pyrophosphohydrolase [gamma proteobacterium endosymbiont of Lamellibrachia anaximandri]|nr:bifunctional (p)ppGpp synthetase/guanosine-3',5'-bis(diphosphate) 3'-pyrophosphohydrolase [gamma proteobacterium endosymbiont of Lamellibrachia anaximandri]MBL3535318.1 bifunctional (p)ppGpp synthetase/guanosine-3',5'-bis(diphosphate) 3'-pyrophosphohydrolase [gamma proteobacterium endosymbiont of Lamellibrachia anaximandri]
MNDELLHRARAFAVEAHGAQRYGDKPYIYHLDQVAGLVESYGNDAQAIGYLHDVVEDTPVNRLEVAEVFGHFVGACVEIVTDEPGRTREERKRKTNQKMRRVSGSHELALVVKAADRLANVTACITERNNVLLERYLREQAVFRSAVYRKGLCDDIWTRLSECLKA